MAKDYKDNNIKSFGLDRIQKLDITKKKYLFPDKFDVYEMFKNCYGIYTPKNVSEQPETIVLSFEPVDGRYLKSNKLHEFQEVIIDNEEEIRIKLRVYITPDFIMELLSHGENLEIISPAKLKKEIRKIYSQALKQYES